MLILIYYKLYAYILFLVSSLPLHWPFFHLQWMCKAPGNWEQYTWHMPPYFPQSYILSHVASALCGWTLSHFLSVQCHQRIHICYWSVLLIWSQCFLTMSYRATNSPRSLLPQEVNVSNTSLFSLLWTSWKSAVGLLERIFGKFHKRFQTFPLCESYIRIDNLCSLLNINIHTACEMWMEKQKNEKNLGLWWSSSLLMN